MIEMENEAEFYRLFGMVAKMAVRVNQETDHCVFFSFSGHIDGFELRIAETKKDYGDDIYLERNYAQSNLSDKEMLQEFFRKLCSLLDSQPNAEKLLEAA